MAVPTQPTKTKALESDERQVRLRQMVEDYVPLVTRTLRQAGVPPSEVDDAVQRTFIVAVKRIDDLERGAERTFLYQVALHTAAHVHRALGRRREVTDDQVPESIDRQATPEELTSRKELRRLLDEVVARMGRQLYEVFKLYEFEGARLGEIAKRLGVPRGTVASRLRRARAVFRKHAGAIDLAWDLGGEGGNRLEEPEILSREKMSRFMEALLRAGVSRGASPAVRMGTLAALGLPTRSSAF